MKLTNFEKYKKKMNITERRGAGGAAGAGAGVSSGHGKPFTMEVGLDKFRVLHNELKQARLLMKSL